MSTVLIRVDGVDITEDVIYPDAEFIAQVNGQPGQCRIRVKDTEKTRSFLSGDVITVDVDGVRVWGGYATRVLPGFFFPAVDTTNLPTVDRQWTIEGVDWNILFSKRVIYNKANPTKPPPSYPAGMIDRDIILDVIADLTDLGSDGISTAGVLAVGIPSPDEPLHLRPGETVGSAFTVITRSIGSIFYIDPAKVLHHVDVDVPNASFGLSDRPAGGQVGYREMLLNRDGTRLLNDAYVWGAGQGLPTVQNAHVEDAASIAAHGRWQGGEFTTMLYTTTGVNRRANSLVYGTPQSKRGGKDDRISVGCIIFTPGLVVGQKVNFETEVFNFTDVLPIRRMGIKFPSPTDAEFHLDLSHEVDAPWQDYEFWFPRFNFRLPPIGGGIDIPPIVFPPVAGCDCGITDSFSNDVALVSGTAQFLIPPHQSTSGIQWSASTVSSGSASAEFEVDDGHARIEIGPGPINTGPRNVFQFLPISISQSFALTLRLRFPQQDLTTAFIPADASILMGAGGSDRVEIRYTMGPDARIELFSQTTEVGQVLGALDSSKWYHIRWEVDAQVEMRFRIWAEDESEPSTWTITASLAGQPFWVNTSFSYFLDSPRSNTGSTGTVEMWLDDLAIDGVDNCTQFRFDNFDRVVNNGWGISSDGHEWVLTFSGGTYTRTVSNDEGRLAPSVTSVIGQVLTVTDAAGPWSLPSFTMRALIRIVNTGSPSTGNNNIQFRLTQSGGGGGNNDAIIYIRNIATGTAGVALDTSFVAKSITAGTYNVKFVYNRTGTSTLTVWLSSVTEPVSPDVSFDMTDRTANQFSVVTSLRSPADIRFLYIDFEYEGKDCSRDCVTVDTTTIVDDFQRSVVGSLGTATEGSVWIEDPESGTPPSVSVDGSRGLFTQGGASGITDYRITIDDYANSLPWLETRWLASSTGLFMTGTVHTPSGASALEWQMYTNLVPDPDEYGIRWGRPGQFFEFPTSNFQITLDDTPFWVALRADFAPSAASSIPILRMKAWLASNPEPANWMDSMSLGTVTGNELTQCAIRASGVSSTGSIYHIEATYPLLECEDIPPGEGGAVGGGICEQFDGGGIEFEVSGSYLPGTTRVYIDGLLMRLNLDYTETDPLQGLVTMGESTPSGSTVTICYTANTAPIGGGAGGGGAIFIE